MNVKQAKDIARQWVIDEASKEAGFYGAFFAGSTNWLPEDAPFPATSDMDVKIVTAASNPPDRLGHFLYRGILFGVSYWSSDQFQSPDIVLSNYHMAGHFTTPNIILDPSGQLTKVQAAVSRDFARREWVQKRCDQARNQVLTSLQWLQEAQPFHDQVFAWVYPTSVMTHVLLVAGLKNPTVRRMYVATRDLLAAYNQLSFYETLLTLLGSVNMNRAQVEEHLAALTEVFDVAKEIVKTPFFDASAISDYARPIAIDGSRQLIEQGYHREAIFWIALTQSWCQKALYNDAPVELQERFKPAYRRLMRDLGITSFADLQQRHDQVRDCLPRLWEVAEGIMAAHSDIKD